MTKSNASNARTRPGRTLRNNRQPATNIADITACITDRGQLTRLRDITKALNERYDKPFRWIAAHTWRGPTKFSYWQVIARGGHLKKKPSVRPRLIDLITAESILSIVRETERACTEIAIDLDTFLIKRAEADQAMVNLILKSAKRSRSK